MAEIVLALLVALGSFIGTFTHQQYKQYHKHVKRKARTEQVQKKGANDEVQTLR